MTGARELEQRLRRRLRLAVRRRGCHCAHDWDGKAYGYGAGRAHPSVEFVPCPLCHAKPGELCRGAWKQPIFSIHYTRGRAFRELKKKVLERG